MEPERGEDNSSKRERTDGLAGDSLRRRTLLKLTGSAAAVGGGLVGFSGGVAASPTPDEFQFDRVLHAVDDLGMDPTGGESISPTLEANYQDDTKIVFPPGTYKITDMLYGTSVSNFGMEGLGSSPRDVQFRPPAQSPGTRYRFAVVKGGGPHMWRNLSFQQRDDDYTSVSMRIITQGGTLFEDVEWLGVTPTDENCRDELLSVSASRTDGVVTCRRVVMGVDASGIKPGYPNGTMGIRAEKSHNGEVRLENCRIEGLGSTAFRHAHANGVLTVRGGFFRNNDLCQMRIAAGDHPSKVSSIKGATSITTEVVDATMALQFDNSRRTDAGVLVEDCDIRYTVDENSRGVITCPNWGDHGSFTLRNCRIRNDGSNQTLNVDDTSTQPDEVTIENCHFTGAGTGDIVIEGRSGSVIRDSCIDMPNADVVGDVTMENVSTEGCDTPDDGNPDSEPDPSASVSTGSAADVDGDSATLSGSLDELVDLSSVDVCIETCEAGTEDWTDAGHTSRSDTGEFSIEASGLAANTAYDFRAAIVDDAVSGTGETKTFSTPMPEDAHTLAVKGTGSTSNYQITVTGELTAHPDRDDVEEWDSIDGSGVSGYVTDDGDVDTYAFTGEVDTLEPDGAAVFVDGDRIDDGAPPERRTVAFHGTGSSANYTVTVSGELSAHPESDDLQPWDSIDGSSASGWVTYEDNTDTYAFTGEITDLDPDGAVVFVDGERVEAGDSEPQQHTLTFEGTGSSANYQVTVSGELSADSERDNLQPWDDLTESSASGWVTYEDNADSYTFTGEITDLDPDGAAVYVDGDAVDPSSI
jgi:hypothetical protein